MAHTQFQVCTLGCASQGKTYPHTTHPKGCGGSVRMPAVGRTPASFESRASLWKLRGSIKQAEEGRLTIKQELDS